jgi:hypothetical protein
MTRSAAFAALRKRDIELYALPDTIAIPALEGRQQAATRPVSALGADRAVDALSAEGGL